jgi:hypothetical protein
MTKGFGTPAMMQRAQVCCLAVVVALSGGLPAQGIRVVDSVVVGQAGDEAAHHFAGAETTLGKSAGRPWRSATGWFSYSLRIYDDSPLTLVCLLADGEGAAESFDVLVDGEKTARVIREAGKTTAATIEFRLAFKDTRGKTSIVVKLAASAGSRTARVLEVRTVQEHLE